MSQRRLVLAIFADEASADHAAGSLRDSGLADGDALGVLALDPDGQLKVDKVGARSSGKGAAIGGVLLLLGPAALGVGVIGGTAAGALHHKGLGLDKADKQRITKELTNGRAAVGVLAKAEESDLISQILADIGGTPELHAVTEEGLEAAAAAAGS